MPRPLTLGQQVPWGHFDGPSDVPPLDGKRFVITGAGRGIGYHAAIGLAQRGANVTCICRIGERESEMNYLSLSHMVGLNSGKLDVIWADLADPQCVRLVADTINARGEPVDCLINNAAIQTPGVRWLLDDGREKQMRVNYMSHFALTGLLMPSLLKSKEPRVVNVSSLSAWRGSLTWDGVFDFANSKNYRRKAVRFYDDSKLAQLAFTKELARRYPQVTSVATHPGFVETLLAPFNVLVKHVSMYAEEGARLPLAAATLPGVQSGSYVGPTLVLRGSPSPFHAWYPPQATREDVGKRLWEASVAETGVDY
uniref:Uncharacterized protein n=1 Tax=Neobodo designis TaxID=312471 RepID=A0A6U4PC02_NEODS|mmetsp:Transcript_13548/g.42166  ORF Transcript_13548/g.42166 Transcript_13548/m.42166 type:complete len:311 (+) Transcript_13548:46-978(+)